MKKRRVSLISLMVFCIWYFGTFTTANANSKQVSANLLVDPWDLSCGGAVYCTVQDAVDAASVGDTIDLATGVYGISELGNAIPANGALQITTPDIVIEAGTTVFDVGSTGPVLVVNSTGVVFNGGTISNGSGTAVHAGGVTVYGSITFQDTSFEGNVSVESSIGAAVQIYGGGALGTFSDVTFSQNSNVASGSIIQVSGTLLLEDCTALDNTGHNVIGNSDLGVISIHRCVIDAATVQTVNNLGGTLFAYSSVFNGGYIAIGPGNATFDHVTFVDTSASRNLLSVNSQFQVTSITVNNSIFLVDSLGVGLQLLNAGISGSQVIGDNNAFNGTIDNFCVEIAGADCSNVTATVIGPTVALLNSFWQPPSTSPVVGAAGSTTVLVDLHGTPRENTIGAANDAGPTAVTLHDLSASMHTSVWLTVFWGVFLSLVLFGLLRYRHATVSA